MANNIPTGKSTTKLQSRISGHRSHVGDDVFDEAKLAEHIQSTHNLSSIDLFNRYYSFSVLEVGL